MERSEERFKELFAGKCGDCNGPLGTVGSVHSSSEGHGRAQGDSEHAGSAPERFRGAGGFRDCMDAFSCEERVGFDNLWMFARFKGGWLSIMTRPRIEAESKGMFFFPLFVLLAIYTIC